MGRRKNADIRNRGVAATVCLALALNAGAVTGGAAAAYAEEPEDTLKAGSIDYDGQESADDPASASSDPRVPWDSLSDLPDPSAASEAAASSGQAASTDNSHAASGPDGTEFADASKPTDALRATAKSNAAKDKALGSSGAFSTVAPAFFPVIPNPTTEVFIDSIAEPAREIGQKDGLYASVMIAQAILESGSGSSGLSKPPYNNLFGIKGAYKGASVVLMTSEDDGSGYKYNIAAEFRRYPSVKESLQDYADLLRRDMGAFYAPAWKENAKTYVEACDYLQGHYATDTTYSGKLQGIILAYDLEQYDHPIEWAQSEEGKAARANALFEAAPLARKSLSSAQITPLGSGADAQAAVENGFLSAEESASDGAQAPNRPEQPLQDRGVQVSLLSLGALTAVFAKSEISMLLASLKLGFHLPFIGR